MKNRERRALAHFYRLGQLNPPALSGGDILKVVYGATFRFDKTALIDELHAMAERIHQEWQQGKRLEPRPRILITGCDRRRGGKSGPRHRGKRRLGGRL